MNLHRIAAVITSRFIRGFWRLAQSVEEDTGRAIKELLEGQFEGQSLNQSPTKIWGDVEKKLGQIPDLSPSDYSDIVQDLLRYIVESDHSYSKSADRVAEAYQFFLWNLWKRGTTFAQSAKSRLEEPSGLIEKPEPDIGDLTLDEKVDIKKFVETLDDVIPDLIDYLPFDQAILFDLIFFEDEGTFKAGIDTNMGQASRLKESLEEMDTPEAKQVLEKNKNRWSGYVGETRKKLLQNIQKFIEQNLSEKEYDKFYQAFFSDTTPEKAEKHERGLQLEKEQELLEKDKRKLEKYRKKEERGGLSDKEKKSYKNLKKKIEKAEARIREMEPSEPEPITQRLPEGPPTERLPYSLGGPPADYEEEEPPTQRLPNLSTIASRIAGIV